MTTGQLGTGQSQPGNLQPGASAQGARQQTILAQSAGAPTMARLFWATLAVAAVALAAWEVAGAPVRYLLALLAKAGARPTLATAESYRQVVRNSGPIAYYRLNETAGSVANDSSGHGNNATLSVAAYDQGGPFPGSASAAFNGISSVVTLPDGFGDGTFPNGFSFEGWVYWSNSGYSGEPIFEFVNSPGTNDRVTLVQDGGNPNLGFRVDQGGARGPTLVGVGMFPYHQWAYVAVTLDGAGTATLYRNGALVTSGTVWTPNNVARHGTLAMPYSGLQNPLAGNLSECAFYQRALTAQEVYDHWETAQTGYGGAYQLFTQALSAAVGSVATLLTAAHTGYRQVVAAVAGSAPVLAAGRIVARPLVAVAGSASQVAARLGSLYLQALTTATAGVSDVGTALFRRYQQALMAASGGAATVGVYAMHVYAQALAVIAGSAPAVGAMKVIHQLVGAVAGSVTSVGSGVSRRYQQALAALAGSTPALATRMGVRYVVTLLAQAGSTLPPFFSGRVYQQLLATTVGSVAHLLTPLTRQLGLYARTIGLGGLSTNKNTLYQQALVVAAGSVVAMAWVRGKLLMATTSAAAALTRRLSLSVVVLATTVGRAQRLFQKITSQAGSLLPFKPAPLVAIGAPGPWFAIDGDLSIKQPDQFQTFNRPLLGISLRRRPQYGGWPSQTWTWSDLAYDQYQAIVAKWRQGGPWHDIQWMGQDNALHTARAHMQEPTIGGRFGERLLQVQVKFSEVQPAQVEAPTPWQPLAWNPPPPAASQPAPGRKLIAMDDQGILCFDQTKSPAWFWLFKPGLAGIYTTCVDPHDLTQQTMICARQGGAAFGTRQDPAPYGSEGSIWTTNDGGVTWTAVATSNLPMVVQAAAKPGWIIPSPYQTNSVGYWNPQYDPTTPGRVLCLACYGVNAYAPGTGVQLYAVAICESTNGGQTWHVLQELLGNPTFDSTGHGYETPHMALSKDGQSWFAATAGQAAYANICSWDGGHTWQATPGLPTSDYGWAYWFVVDPNDASKVYAVNTYEGAFLLKSTDGGHSWQNLYTLSNLPANDGAHANISWAFVLCGADPLGKANPRFYVVQNSAAAPNVVGGYVNLTGDFLDWVHFPWDGALGDQGTTADAWQDPQAPGHFIIRAGTTFYETRNSGGSFASPSPTQYPQPTITNQHARSLEVLG